MAEKRDPKEAKRNRQKAADLRRKQGTARPANEEARKYLSPKEMAMPLDRLHQHLADKGFTVSRSTAWRAKKTGYFYPEHIPSFGTRRMELTPEERAASPKFLAERFGLTVKTAREAKRRGWIGVDVNSRGRITIPFDRFVPPIQLKPETVMTRVGLTKEEREAFPEFLAERFGISHRTATKAKKRGWFQVLSAMRAKLKIPADRTMPSIFPGKKVALTSMEKKLSQANLARRFSINRTTARSAKETGFFQVSALNLAEVKIPADRTVSLDLLEKGRGKRRGRSK